MAALADAIVRTVERAPTPFVESGRAVTLEVVIYKPQGPGPHPAVIFNHGSTGDGNDPSQFRITYTNEAIARFFADRGWLVAFAQRRGRGAGRGGGVGGREGFGLVLLFRMFQMSSLLDRLFPRRAGHSVVAARAICRE